jgi:hypothetical protein
MTLFCPVFEEFAYSWHFATFLKFTFEIAQLFASILMPNN